jgi:hypothetical protein
MKSYTFNVERKGASLFLIICTLAALKLSESREINMFDSNFYNEEFLKSRDVSADNLLPLKILNYLLATVINLVLMLRNYKCGRTLPLKELRRILSPTFNNFVLRSRKCRSSRTLSVKRVRFLLSTIKNKLLVIFNYSNIRKLCSEKFERELLLRLSDLITGSPAAHSPRDIDREVRPILSSRSSFYI